MWQLNPSADRWPACTSRRIHAHIQLPALWGVDPAECYRQWGRKDTTEALGGQPCSICQDEKKWPHIEERPHLGEQRDGRLRVERRWQVDELGARRGRRQRRDLEVSLLPALHRDLMVAVREFRGSTAQGEGGWTATWLEINPSSAGKNSPMQPATSHLLKPDPRQQHVNLGGIGVPA